MYSKQFESKENPAIKTIKKHKKRFKLGKNT